MEPGRPNYRRQLSVFLLFLGITILYAFLMDQLIWPLGSGDIIRLETARTVANLQDILTEFREFTPSKLEKAIDSVYLDFVFILLYGGLMISAIKYFGLLADHDLVERASRFFIVVVVLACVCDVVENLLILKTLKVGPTELGVRMTYNLAAAKFSMIIISVMFIFLELAYVGLSRIVSRKDLKLSK